MKVTIMRGLPGSGKTTLVRRWVKEALEHDRYPLVFSADDFFTDPKTGEYRFDPTRAGEAHAWCFRRFLDILAKGRTDLEVIVDNTNTTPAEIAPYTLAAAAYVAEVEVITVLCDPLVAARRNTHGAPPHVVLAMHARMLREELPLWWKHTAILLE